jgi:hypothetical protein
VRRDIWVQCAQAINARKGPGRTPFDSCPHRREGDSTCCRPKGASGPLAPDHGHCGSGTRGVDAVSSGQDAALRRTCRHIGVAQRHARDLPTRPLHAAVLLCRSGSD